MAGTQQTLFAIDSIAASAYPVSDSSQKVLKNTKAVASWLDADLAAVRIAAPVSGAIVALDPDIPPVHQRLQFVAAPVSGHAALRWHLDGKALGQGARLAWLPWPGRHVLQLQDARGKVLDEVRFEVRGAGVQAAVASHPPGLAARGAGP